MVCIRVLGGRFNINDSTRAYSENKNHFVIFVFRQTTVGGFARDAHIGTPHGATSMVLQWYKPLKTETTY